MPSLLLLFTLMMLPVVGVLISSLVVSIFETKSTSSANDNQSLIKADMI